MPQRDSLSIVNHCPGTGKTSINSFADVVRLDTDSMSGMQPTLPWSWKCRADGYPPEEDFKPEIGRM